MRQLMPLALGAALLASALPAAAQGAARAGPFDPQSGRFASAIPSEPPRAPDTVSASPAKVWVAINQAYVELGIPVTVVDTETKVVGALRATQRRLVAGERLSRILECGSGAYGPNADRYTVQLTSLSSVSAAGDKTVID